MDLAVHLEKLKGFQAVAKHGSFHGAASELNISQPSLSHSIKVLEQSMNIQLFHRSPKGVRLTAQGKHLLEFSNRLFKEVEDIEVKIKGQWDELNALRRVGIYESIAVQFWPHFFRTFKKNYPQTRIHLLTGRSQNLIKKLRNNDIDLAISVEPSEDRSLKNIMLYSDEFAFYRGTRQEMDKRPLILFSSALARGNSLLLEEIHKLENREIIEVESFEAAREFAIQGMGAALLPKRIARSYVEGDQLKILSIKEVHLKKQKPHRIFASYNSSDEGDPVIDRMVSQLKSYFS